MNKKRKRNETNLKQSWTKHKPGSSALGCVKYLVVFLKRKGNVLSGIILFLAYWFERGEVLKICGGLILFMTLVMFMVLDSEEAKFFLKAIVSEWERNAGGYKSFSNQELCDSLCLF